MSLYLLLVSYIAMALAGFVIGLAFNVLGIAPSHTHVVVINATPSWNYTTFLNIAFLLVVAALAWRFLTTGGPAMLRSMSVPPGEEHEMAHDHHH